MLQLPSSNDTVFLPPLPPGVGVAMDAGITYDVMREVVALEDDAYLPSNVVFLGRHFLLPRGETHGKQGLPLALC